MANVHTFSGSHKLTVLLPIASQGDLNTSWVSPFADGEGADRAVFKISVGALTEEVDMALFQATDSNGTGRKVIVGAEVTQLTSSTDERTRTVEIGPGALDDANGFKFVRAEITVDGAGNELYSVEMIQHRLRYPGNFEQAASYDEAVIVLGQN